jgi:hypothetical protein
MRPLTRRDTSFVVVAISYLDALHFILQSHIHLFFSFRSLFERGMLISPTETGDVKILISWIVECYIIGVNYDAQL